MLIIVSEYTCTCEIHHIAKEGIFADFVVLLVISEINLKIFKFLYSPILGVFTKYF